MMVRICSQVIKTIAREVSEPLSRLSNLTCLTGTIPHDLKIALLTPNFKANENNDSRIIGLYLFTALIMICEMKEIK